MSGSNTISNNCNVLFVRSIALLFTVTLFSSPIYADPIRSGEPFSYPAWDFARLPDAPPILMPMAVGLIEAVHQGVRNEGRGPGLQIDIQTECGLTGATVFVGFFDSSDEFKPPLYVREFPDVGVFDIDSIPEGDYCVGALAYDPQSFNPYRDVYEGNWENRPRIAAFHQTWPQPVRIREGVSNAVTLLLSDEFRSAMEFSRSGVSLSCYFDSQRMKNERGLYPRLTVRVVDENGVPLPFCAVKLDEIADNGQIDWFHNLMTDRDGCAYTNAIPGLFRIGAERNWFFSDSYICIYQAIRKSGVHDVRRETEVSIQWAPLFEESNSLSAKVVDRNGDGVEGYYFCLTHDRVPEEALQDRVFTQYEIPVANSAGTFEIGGLVSFPYEITIRGFDYPLYENTDNQDYPILDFSSDAAIQRDFVLTKKNAFYGIVKTPNGEPLKGYVTVWYRKYTAEERAENGGWPGEFFTGGLDEDGAFRVTVTEAEKNQVDENMKGYIDVQDDRGIIQKVKLDTLSTDPNAPTEIVFHRAASIKNALAY